MVVGSSFSFLSACAKHVLLDEPFEQLDPAKKTRLLRHLKGYDGTVLVNTHETWLIKRLYGLGGELYV